MKIDELSDQEKTVMLARLCGWIIKEDGSKTWVTCQDEAYSTTNLYQPIFMLLAWRVLNWAGANFNKARPGDWRGAMYGSRHSTISELVGLSPADAQRAWLDRILSLAIEAGMVEDDE